jgi:hypothetical protein
MLVVDKQVQILMVHQNLDLQIHQNFDPNFFHLVYNVPRGPGTKKRREFVFRGPWGPFFERIYLNGCYSDCNENGLIERALTRSLQRATEL